MQTSAKKTIDRRQVGYVWMGVGAMLLILLVLAGCKTLETVAQVGAEIGVASGVLTESQATSIQKSARAVARTFEDFTPEQEYYIGRTVGAMVLQKYRPLDDHGLNLYLNELGQTLAKASDMPQTFGGYHFLVQDSEEINAFAAPGGLIFVTRGMLRCAKTEDALAAVLAHEIGHTQLKHGLQAIKKARISSALTTIGMESAKTFGGEDLVQLTQTFENTIADITQTMINSGYSRQFEYQADAIAVKIMNRVGYDPNALVEMLSVMEARLKPGGFDFAKTHPSPASRIADISKLIGHYAPVTPPQARQARFLKYLGNS